MAALGLELGDLFEPTVAGLATGARERANAVGMGRLVATYPYVDEQGRDLFEVVRFEPKAFLQRHRDPASKGGWAWNVQGVRHRVLYRLPKVIEAISAGVRVWIAEGEKDVAELERLGFVATCNAGGAGKWRAEHADALRGAAAAVVVADRDDPGRQHATRVANSLLGMVANVKVVEVPTGKDAADWTGAGAGKADFDLLADSTQTWVPTVEPIAHRVGGNAANLISFTAKREAKTGKAVEWELPLPLEVRTSKPFPLGALPEDLRSLVEAVGKEYSAPADLPALGVLATIASLAMRIARVNLNGAKFIQPTGLFVIAAAESGQGKGAFGAMFGPLAELQHQECCWSAGSAEIWSGAASWRRGGDAPPVRLT